MILTETADIKLIREAGRIAGAVLEKVTAYAKPGLTTLELDEYAEKLIREAGALPTFKGYRGFPGTLCTSVNEEIVHGIPGKRRVLKEGDILSLDIGATMRREDNGKSFDFIGDTALTFAIGSVPERTRKLMDDTQQALYAGIKMCRNGASLDDVAGAIEDIAVGAGWGIVREYGGHGIGPNYHEDPFIFNYRTGSETKLKSGMVIAIEPMFNHGGDKVRLKPDGWTVITEDYKLSAHFEHSVLVTEDEPEVLTKRPSETIK
jgi:methionyl aminopeptidase